MARAPKNFAGEITPCFPTIAAKAQRHRAGLVLAKEFDAARSQILRPVVADSFDRREIARRGNDQTRPHNIEKRPGAGISRVMLSFDDDVTVEIQTVGQKRALGFYATSDMNSTDVDGAMDT